MEWLVIIFTIMKTKYNKYGMIAEFISYFVCSVILTILAKKYQPNLYILPSLFFGVYVSKIITKKLLKTTKL